eukprot:TRINITY_DN2986_c0_g1_i2.p1 TRINITY_DN2986_c0_g1~~TRINITY_DN2986_c0_g1_i2.p1  ORF type:complete len:227 (+),score=49.03 TRINITY_DN2986_c0_g1_i2:48-728(+)
MEVEDHSQQPGFRTLPNQTIYIKNLNDKIRRSEIRRSLYALFSQFGPILSINTNKKPKMRGQAFIVFRDISAASDAIRELNSFNFFNKPLIIEYAKNKSDIIAQLEGNYVPKEKRTEDVEMGENEEQPVAQEKPTEQKKRVIPQQKPAPPNKTLYIQNLPENVSEVILQTLFDRYPGFKELRIIPGGRGIAFAEYQNEMQAAVALNELHGFRLEGDYTMVVSFQKR